MPSHDVALLEDLQNYSTPQASGIKLGDTWKNTLSSEIYPLQVLQPFAQVRSPTAGHW